MLATQQPNQYFMCLRGEPLNPIPWNIPHVDETRYHDYIFFGKVLDVLQQNLKLEGLQIYVTWSLDELPSYGSNVVAVLLGDEWCRIPTYAHKVLAVFKCYGSQPTLGFGSWTTPYLNLLALIQFFKNIAYRCPGVLNYRFQQVKSFSLRTPIKHNIYDIPLGYYNQLDLPIQDFNTRPYDVSFAGSIAFQVYPWWSIRFWLKTPKNIARQQMVLNLNKIKDQHLLKIDLTVTSQFGFQGDRNTEAKAYSEKLMNTRICLVPRGSSLETLRFFEALRYGCIVIAERLPSRWFYTGSPAIQLMDWNELEKVLTHLLQDPVALQKKHEASLNWWQEKCSEDAVGRFMAEQINTLTHLKYSPQDQPYSFSRM